MQNVLYSKVFRQKAISTTHPNQQVGLFLRTEEIQFLFQILASHSNESDSSLFISTPPKIQFAFLVIDFNRSLFIFFSKCTQLMNSLCYYANSFFFEIFVICQLVTDTDFLNFYCHMIQSCHQSFHTFLLNLINICSF